MNSCETTTNYPDRPTDDRKAAEHVCAEKFLLLPTTRPADSILNQGPAPTGRKKRVVRAAAASKDWNPVAPLYICRPSIFVDSGTKAGQTVSIFSDEKRKWAQEVPRGIQRNAIFF